MTIENIIGDALLQRYRMLAQRQRETLLRPIESCDANVTSQKVLKIEATKNWA